MGWRDGAWTRLQNDAFDVLVVGGGITGAGIALEATLRGYRPALIDKNDFASGTSRRSTKLVHGGLRYLLLGGEEFVRESLAERTFLLEHAPTLVRPMPFLLPLQTSPESPAFVQQFLQRYESMAEASPLPPVREVGRDEFAERFSTIEPSAGAFEYHECVTDDARLTLAVLHAAIERGAVALSHTALLDLDPGPRGVRVSLRDQFDGRQRGIDVPQVILAVGAWLAELANVEMRPAKGTHVVLEQPDPVLESALLLRHADGRFLTLVPWYDRLLLGSTDTECEPGELDRPLPTPDEVAYLLQPLQALAPAWSPTVTAAWSGVRPLLGAPGARTADLSREDRLLDLMPGVTAIAGGKLTTFRRLAQRCLDHLDAQTGHSGSVDAFPVLVEPSDFELVTTLDDMLTQRMPLSLLRPDEACAAAPAWSERVGRQLGWTLEEQSRQTVEYRAGLDRFRAPG